jgi:hypothetical protein
MKVSSDRADVFLSSQTRRLQNGKTMMNKTIRLALIGASILVLASPALARSGGKGDRMVTRHGTDELRTAPVRLRDRTPEQLAPVYGRGPNTTGFDRASSPYAGGAS